MIANITATRAMPPPSGWWMSTVVSCVIVKTKTRSKNSSRVLTRVSSTPLVSRPMLTLRRGTVVDVRDHPPATEQRLTIEVDGARRPAVADVALVGFCAVGDDVVVNTVAVELGLGSGGFDIVHVNLTRGLGVAGAQGAHVMKLNYTSLQHAVHPVEGEELRIPLDRPVAVFGLHGQLAPIAWAFRQASARASLGYVQTAGGALPGGHSRVVRELRARGLLAGHITAGPCF